MTFDRNGVRTHQPAPTPPDPVSQAAAAQGARSLEQQTLDRVREGLAGQATATPPVEPDPAVVHADREDQVRRARDDMLARLGRRPTADAVTLARPALGTIVPIRNEAAAEPRPGQEAAVDDALAQMRQALRLPPLPPSAA